MSRQTSRYLSGAIPPASSRPQNHPLRQESYATVDGDPFSEEQQTGEDQQELSHQSVQPLQVRGNHASTAQTASMYSTAGINANIAHDSVAVGEESYPMGAYGADNSDNYASGQEEAIPLTSPLNPNNPGPRARFMSNQPRPSSGASNDSENNKEGFKRQQTVKRSVTKKAKLGKLGNFNVEHRVPQAVLQTVEPQWREGCTTSEFTHMRYTAATCDPDDFTSEKGWSLRTSNYGRHTEILICVTSYNEDKALYLRTLHGVMSNIRDICRNKSSKYWRNKAEDGIPNWTKITVALITDGMDKLDRGVLDVFSTMGLYQDICVADINGKATEAHIFEYTTQISIDPSKPNAKGMYDLIIPHEGSDKSMVPVQFILVSKVKNAKKINSHRWLFNAIGKHLKPTTCILLDAGTKPAPRSIWYLWEQFYNDKHCGGCCGEIYAELRGGRKLLNPLVAAQNFEYKMSNILDKPLESTFGYVSVLPGAFSAYRYEAIQGRPLEQYFHGDHSMADRLGKKGIHGMNIFTKNMFLAEDRILCWELVAKRDARWTLCYVKMSRAETDVPEQAAEFISQRRRWLNGSFAAGVYALIHFFQIWRTRHNPIRLFFFHIQALYNVFSLAWAWFAPANLWLTFSIVIGLLPHENNPDSATPPFYVFGTPDATHWVNLVFEWTWLGLLALQFVMALGNRPKGERTAYRITLITYAFLSLYLIFCSIFLTVNAFTSASAKLATFKTIGEKISFFLQGTNFVLLAALLGTFGIYFFGSFLYWDMWHLFSSMPQYLLLAPSFTNVLNVYAFCNLHDVSWGTKGSDTMAALPSIKTVQDKNGVQTVEFKAPAQHDVDDFFHRTVAKALLKDEEEEVHDKPSEDDQNKTFRTRLVSVWALTNAALVVAIQNANGLNVTSAELRFRQESCNYSVNTFYQFLLTYWIIDFNILLFSTFALSLVKGIGALIYWGNRQACRLCRRS